MMEEEYTETGGCEIADVSIGKHQEPDSTEEPQHHGFGSGNGDDYDENEDDGGHNHNRSNRGNFRGRGRGPPPGWMNGPPPGSWGSPPPMRFRGRGYGPGGPPMRGGRGFFRGRGGPGGPRFNGPNGPGFDGNWGPPPPMMGGPPFGPPPMMGPGGPMGPSGPMGPGGPMGPPPSLMGQPPYGGPPPPMGPPNMMQELWVETKSDDGKSYYYHARTRETTWTRPQESPTCKVITQAEMEAMATSGQLPGMNGSMAGGPPMGGPPLGMPGMMGPGPNGMMMGPPGGPGGPPGALPFMGPPPWIIPDAKNDHNNQEENTQSQDSGSGNEGSADELMDAPTTNGDQRDPTDMYSGPPPGFMNNANAVQNAISGQAGAPQPNMSGGQTSGGANAMTTPNTTSGPPPAFGGWPGMPGQWGGAPGWPPPLMGGMPPVNQPPPNIAGAAQTGGVPGELASLLGMPSQKTAPVAMDTTPVIADTAPQVEEEIAVPAEVVTRAAEWTTHRAPDGRPYYYCAKKQESVWEKPQPLKELEEWNAKIEARKRKLEGKDGVMEVIDVEAHEQAKMEQVAAERRAAEEKRLAEERERLEKERIEKERLDKEKVEKEKKEKEENEKKSKWVMHISGTPWCVVWTGDGSVFFYNPTAHQSVWERPEQLMGRADVDKAVSAPPEALVEKQKKEALASGAAVSIGGGAVAGAAVASASIDLKRVANDSDSDDSDRGQPKKQKLDEAKKPASTEASKEAAIEAEVRAARERAVVPLETRINSFRQMLHEKEVSAFSTWEKELHKIVFDSRYLLLTSKERKQVFDKYVRERADEERKEKRNRIKQKKDNFRALMEEAKLHSKSSYSEFASKYAKDDRFRGIDKTRERESLFNEYIVEVRKREKDEKAAKREQVRKEFMSLLKEKEVDRHARWNDIKKKLDSEPRYKAVESSALREDMFREYCKLVKEEKEKEKKKDKDKDKSDRDSRSSRKDKKDKDKDKEKEKEKDKEKDKKKDKGDTRKESSTTDEEKKKEPTPPPEKWADILGIPEEERRKREQEKKEQERREKRHTKDTKNKDKDVDKYKDKNEKERSRKDEDKTRSSRDEKCYTTVKKRISSDDLDSRVTTGATTQTNTESAIVRDSPKKSSPLKSPFKSPVNVKSPSKSPLKSPENTKIPYSTKSLLDSLEKSTPNSPEESPNMSEISPVDFRSPSLEKEETSKSPTLKSHKKKRKGRAQSPVVTLTRMAEQKSARKKSKKDKSPSPEVVPEKRTRSQNKLSKDSSLTKHEQNTQPKTENKKKKGK